MQSPETRQAHKIIEASIGKPWVNIYRIDFADGSAYIGKTKKKVYSRLLEHAKQPTSLPLCNMIWSGAKFQISTIAKFNDNTAASDYEVKCIAELDKPLNQLGSDISPNLLDYPYIPRSIYSTFMQRVKSSAKYYRRKNA